MQGAGLVVLIIWGALGDSGVSPSLENSIKGEDIEEALEDPVDREELEASDEEGDEARGGVSREAVRQGHKLHREWQAVYDSLPPHR